MSKKEYTRREFIKQNSLTGLGAVFGMGLPSMLMSRSDAETSSAEQEPIIDIHQHTDYGGWTDQLLSNYPNMYGDLSQTSGLTALIRDEDHARGFLERHQDQLLFGSDCSDRYPSDRDARCTQGVPILDAIRRLSPNKEIERKILYENAKKLFRL